MDSEDILRKCHQKKGPDPGSEIRDPEKIHPGSGSRIQGVKKHRIPDLDPQHCMSPNPNLPTQKSRFLTTAPRTAKSAIWLSPKFAIA
jgi:hypothetical protein